MQDKGSGEVFARKIIRIFDAVRKEDIADEARVISELCQPGRSKTVVEVMRHDWLPRNPSYYYIDMEYCPETLKNWIRRWHGNDMRQFDSRIRRGLNGTSIKMVSDMVQLRKLWICTKYMWMPN